MMLLQQLYLYRPEWLIVSGAKSNQGIGLFNHRIDIRKISFPVKRDHHGFISNKVFVFIVIATKVD